MTPQEEIQVAQSLLILRHDLDILRAALRDLESKFSRHEHDQSIALATLASSVHMAERSALEAEFWSSK